MWQETMVTLYCRFLVFDYRLIRATRELGKHLSAPVVYSLQFVALDTIVQCSKQLPWHHCIILTILHAALGKGKELVR